MELSQADIERIARLIAERLGPSASPDEIKALTADAIERLTKLQIGETPAKPYEPKKLIVNAFGPGRDRLDEAIRAFAGQNALREIALSTVDIDGFRSTISILDYSGYGDDINKLKFELDKICRALGFKAIIQDSDYYGM